MRRLLIASVQVGIPLVVLRITLRVTHPLAKVYPSQLTLILADADAAIDGIGTTDVPTACRRFSSANSGLSP